MSGEQIVTLCIGLASILFSALLSVLSYILFNKKEKIYLKKQDAIYRALTLCDKYLSWNDFYNPDGTKTPDPIRNSDDTTLSITEEARLVYNSLMCSCKRKETIDTFLDLLLGGGGENIFRKYNQFRNMCRKELGLKELKELNGERVFLGKISTRELSNHSQTM